MALATARLVSQGFFERWQGAFGLTTLASGSVRVLDRSVGVVFDLARILAPPSRSLRICRPAWRAVAVLALGHKVRRLQGQFGSSEHHGLIHLLTSVRWRWQQADVRIFL